MISLFKKMREEIAKRLHSEEPGLYIALAFPILFSFLLTFVISRLISYLITYGYIPEIFLEVDGVHVHHFTYGFFILAAAGYLALVFDGPTARYLISLLFGMGLGLSMDEFGMWLKLKDDDPVRWSYDGFTIVILTFGVLIFARPGIRLLKKLGLIKKILGRMDKDRTLD